MTMTDTKQKKHVKKKKNEGFKRLDCYISEAAKAELERLCQCPRGHRATIPETVERLINQGIQLTAAEELQEQMKVSGKNYEHALNTYIARVKKELAVKIGLFKKEILAAKRSLKSS
jgi:thermostable 8-oxoguanine DNA glycosylase